MREVCLVTFADGQLIDQVREEWPLDGADADADLQAWRLGAELYEDDDTDGGELLRAGGLMAAAVRHHLHGNAVLRDDELAVTVQSLLFAASTPVADGGAIPERACSLARLALAAIAQQGWQPEHLGGNGHVTEGIFEDADIQQLLATAVPGYADVPTGTGAS